MKASKCICFCVATEAEGLTGIQTRDWSEQVAPFWMAVIQTALSGAGLVGLLQAGWTTIKVRRMLLLEGPCSVMGILQWTLGGWSAWCTMEWSLELHASLHHVCCLITCTCLRALHNQWALLC